MSVKAGDKIRITEAMLFEPYKNGEKFVVENVSSCGYFVKAKGIHAPIHVSEFEIITNEEVDSMKAEKGDLIRIVEAIETDGYYDNGDILEVVESFEHGVDVDIRSNDGEDYIHVWNSEYVIHRKAGEESVDEEDSQQGALAQYQSEVLGEEQAELDAVNHPNHYTQGKFETIEVIEEITKGYDDGFIAYCIGNTLKYIARAPFKHGSPAEDLAKAKRYIEFAIEHLDAKSTQ